MPQDGVTILAAQVGIAHIVLYTVQLFTGIQHPQKTEHAYVNFCPVFRAASLSGLCIIA
jgi:formate dehydrogenase maturation protein FdhE